MIFAVLGYGDIFFEKAVKKIIRKDGLSSYRCDLSPGRDKSGKSA